MEQIEVTARFDTHGRIIPINFTWGKRTYRVDSIGRQWSGKDGHHILVMTPGNRAHHLLFKLDEGQWYRIQGSDTPTIPVA